ncbi:MAG: right-handed parallel beta-helix repeat-containing protein [Kiritimatiellae bacterium]|nr:right-handed parallel beta-helix repeat-containing protein [Kiritimatiellia bacterium]
MRTKMLIAVAVLSLIGLTVNPVPPARAAGIIRYVAPNGDDANPGTAAQPWKTLRAAVQKSRRPGPGDTVLIKAGTYVESPSWWIHVHGAADNPITFKAYGDGEVRITPSTVLPADGWVHVKDAIYKTELRAPATAVFHNEFPLVKPGREKHPIEAVEDLCPGSFFVSDKTLYVRLVDGSNPEDSVIRTAPSHVIVVDKSEHLIFEGLTLEYGFVGLKESRPSAGITLRNCTLRSLASHGVFTVPETVIEDCRFQKIGYAQTQCAVNSPWSKGLIVRHNVFEEVAGHAVRQYGDVEPPPPGVEIYGNVFRRPRPYVDGRSRDQYMADLSLWGRSQKTRVYNNVFHGEGKRPAIILSRSGNRVWNNTFVGCPTALTFDAQSRENWVQNNIFVNCARSFLAWPAGATPQTLDHNLYFSPTDTPRWESAGVTYASFGEYQKASGQERNSRYADPRLANGAEARLQPGSPAIDTGVALEDVTVDRDGTARPEGTAYDLGAYEFRPSRN